MVLKGFTQPQFRHPLGRVFTVEIRPGVVVDHPHTLRTLDDVDRPVARDEKLFLSELPLVVPSISQVFQKDPVVERFEHWARQHLANGFSLKGAALAVGASERTLARRLQAVLGKSPLSYFQDLRVERAVHLLQTTNASVEQIAEKVGYADGVTLRTLLRRKVGRGARELRQLETWQSKGGADEGEPIDP